MAEVCSKCGKPPKRGGTLVTISSGGKTTPPLCGPCFGKVTREYCKRLRSESAAKGAK